MFNFQPKETEKTIPYFDDVNSSDGWEGHSTSKSIDKLKSEIATNLSLIDCLLVGVRDGKYGDRHGFQIHFSMKSEDGRMIPSRLDIACLPLNPRKRIHNTRRNRPVADWRIESTQKMALYMVAKAIKGMYFLNVLAPSFVPFMSLMLEKNGQTLGQLWIQAGQLAPLLPPPNEEFEDVIDAE